MIPSPFAFSVSGPQCSRRDIEKFEAFAHATLPTDYAEFLLICNGCVPSGESDTFHSLVELPGGNDISVHQFFSLSKHRPPLRNLFTELEADVGFLPLTTIPIGHDSSGNVIGLDCETGQLNWTVCEVRFRLDYLRNYDLGICFSEFLASLRAGPYKDQNGSSTQH